MKLYIYGAGHNGKELLHMIQNEYQFEYETICFLDTYKLGKIEDIPILSPNDINIDKEDRVIIAVMKYEIAVDIYLYLKKAGFNDIWWFEGKKTILYNDFFSEQCISCKSWNEDMLYSVEMHIMDACNLNCRGCTHFSPIFEKKIPDFDSRIRDIKKLCEKISHIVGFYILGGEPFLNPEILKYVVEIRRILPDSEIGILTNGLLIPSVNDEILYEIKRQNIKVFISEYTPTHNIIQKIKERLEKFGIIYNIQSSKQKFNKPLSISNHSKYKNMCISKDCVSVGNGKIARCPTLLYIEAFNQYFHVNLPTEGCMDLDDCPSGLELVDKLKEPVPLCKHCIENEIDWSVCEKEVVLADFAVLD